MNYNRVTLCGRLTRDPELRQLANGQSVCAMAMAVNRPWKDKSGDWREDTLYIDVQAWGKVGEYVAEKARKGAHVLVDGALQMQEWTSKSDGQKRTKILVNAQHIQIVNIAKPEPRENAGASVEAARDTARPSAPSRADDDIPFSRERET